MKKHSPGFASLLLLSMTLLSWFPAAILSASTVSPVEILHLTGQAPCGLFGFSLSSARDINGDGYEDLLIGAPAGFGPGMAYLYYGGTQTDSLPDLKLVGGYRTSQFGITVSSAGDFNADGFGDAVVSEGSWPGSFYIYYGGQTPDSIPDLTLLPPSFGYKPGAAASADLNHDGYTDLLVGYQGLASADRIFVYFGGTVADASPDLELTASPPDLWSTKLTTADINGDGDSDAIVGSASGIRVYFGGAGMNPSEDLGLTGLTIAGDRFLAFAPAGDVNGDGYADLMVATSDAELAHGRVRIYFGGAMVDSIPDVSLHGEDFTAPFGPAMASLGDVNGDGFGDILIGTDLAFGGGKAHLFLGGAPMDSLPALEIDDGTPLSGFAHSVGAADVNGDGIADGLISKLGDCSGYVGTGNPPGEVFIYDFSTPLRARAFVHGENRTIPLVKDASPICVRFEPVRGSYGNADVDMSTIQLLSDADECIRAQSPEAAKLTIVGDTDGNGIAELPAWFARSELANLFGTVRGRRVVNARLVGRLKSCRKFLAPISLTIVGKTLPVHEDRTSVSPNPLNPLGKLRFTTARAGNVSLRLFDVGGRLVRTILSSEPLAAGEHTVPIDGRDAEGTPVASGTYFYALETPEGTERGHFVIAK